MNFFLYTIKLVRNVCIKAFLYTKPVVHNLGPTLRLIESLELKGSKIAVKIGIGGLITLLSIKSKINFSYQNPSLYGCRIS